MSDFDVAGGGGLGAVGAAGLDAHGAIFVVLREVSRFFGEAFKIDVGAKRRRALKRAQAGVGSGELVEADHLTGVFFAAGDGGVFEGLGIVGDAGAVEAGAGEGAGGG